MAQPLREVAYRAVLNAAYDPDGTSLVHQYATAYPMYSRSEGGFTSSGVIVVSAKSSDSVGTIKL